MGEPHIGHEFHSHLYASKGVIVAIPDLYSHLYASKGVIVAITNIKLISV